MSAGSAAPLSPPRRDGDTSLVRTGYPGVDLSLVYGAHGVTSVQASTLRG